MTPLWQLAQVAARLGLSPASFRSRRRRLEDQHGFPGPVPGVGLRWDGAAVEAWLARQRGDQQAAEADAEGLLIARARAMATAA